MVLSGLTYSQTRLTPLCKEWLVTTLFATPVYRMTVLNQVAKEPDWPKCLIILTDLSDGPKPTDWLLKPGGQKTPLDPPDSGRACSPRSWGHTLYLVTLQNTVVFCGPSHLTIATTTNMQLQPARDNHHHAAWLGAWNLLLSRSQAIISLEQRPLGCFVDITISCLN